MSFNVSASASGSDLPRFLPWRMPLLTVVFLGAVITGSGGLTAKNPTVVLLAQQADKRDQNYYANAHPYLEEEPLKKLVKRVPELKGLRPTADQQALPMILEKSGERVDEFFYNVVDLLAHEEIAQERLNGIGAIWASLVRDSYLILRHGDERGASIDEYRMDEKGNRMDHVGLEKGFFVTAGFALSCNYFSTAFQRESRFRYLGDQRIGPRDTYVVAFAQKPGEATLFVTMAEPGGTRIHMLMQGIVWVDMSNFQIIRMRVDLLAPRPEIGLDQQTTSVTFSKVQLLDLATPLWLPKEVKVYLKSKELDSNQGQLFELVYRNEHLCLARIKSAFEMNNMQGGDVTL